MPTIDIAKNKGDFFNVLAESKLSQLAAMTLKPGSDSGPEEIHKGDQILYVIDGQAEVEIEHRRETVGKGQAIIIPAGSQHHVFNTSTEDMFCLNIYSPPEY